MQKYHSAERSWHTYLPNQTVQSQLQKMHRRRCLRQLDDVLLRQPTLPDDKKDLAAVTLRSIALNYIERKGPKSPKTLLKSINKLKKLDDIVITKPDKGSGVFVMNKSIMFICFVKHQSTTQPNSHQSDWRDPQREEDLQSTTTHCSRKKSTLNRLSEESFPMK